MSYLEKLPTPIFSKIYDFMNKDGRYKFILNHSIYKRASMELNFIYYWAKNRHHCALREWMINVKDEIDMVDIVYDEERKKHCANVLCIHKDLLEVVMKEFHLLRGIFEDFSKIRPAHWGTNPVNFESNILITNKRIVQLLRIRGYECRRVLLELVPFVTSFQGHYTVSSEISMRASFIDFVKNMPEIYNKFYEYYINRGSNPIEARISVLELLLTYNHYGLPINAVF